MENDQLDGIEDAVDYIAKLRQAENKSELAVGRRVLVIGGGMTAIDIAVQSKRLGAEEVTIAYRRGPEHMNASLYEQQLALTSGVIIRHWLSPKTLLENNGRISEVAFDYTTLDADGRLVMTGEDCVLKADVIFKAIGQKVAWESLGDTADAIELASGRIRVNENRKTSLADVWAGGDCIEGGEDLTVSAVQDGKLAAINMHNFLSSQGKR